MKKTLVALAVAAFASSASALTVYEADGSKVDFDGSLRLRLDKGDSKVDKAKKTEKHSNLHNDGSRFGVRMKHNIAEDFYALGRVEFRFDGTAAGTDKFGDLYAKRAYVGLGSKQFGELTFGRQILIGDDIAQAGFDYAYGTFDGTLTSASNSAVRYDYKGIEGLQVGLDYRFAENRTNNEVTKDTEKSGYGVGVVYDFKVAEGQSVTLATGYTRDNYATETNVRSYKDAWQVGAKYTINALTLAADYAGASGKNRHVIDKKNDMGQFGDSFVRDGKFDTNWFSVGAKYAFTPAVSAYFTYGHGVVKNKTNGSAATKYTHDKFMLGAAYKVHKNVLTYVEGGVGKVKRNMDATPVAKRTNKDIGVGLRVSW